MFRPAKTPEVKENKTVETKNESKYDNLIKALARNDETITAKTELRKFQYSKEDALQLISELCQRDIPAQKRVKALVNSLLFFKKDLNLNIDVNEIDCLKTFDQAIKPHFYFMA